MIKTIVLFAVFISATMVCGEETSSETKQAKQAATSNKLYAKGVPEKGFLTLKTESYTVPMDAASGWTIEKLEFRGDTFSLNNGHYGTVLRPKAGQWWGTGHTEGGREVVHRLKLIVDGQEVPIKIGETVSGKRVQLIKESTIWKFKVRAEVIINDDSVFERTTLEAMEDCQTDLIYYFMHCFGPTTTKWIARLPDGSIQQGPLNAAGGMKLSKNSTWVAQFDPTKQMGILCYTPKVISGSGSTSMIWDLDRYHKYYLRQNNGQSFNKGDKLDYTVLVKAVPDEHGDWKKTRDAARHLLRLYPPVK